MLTASVAPERASFWGMWNSPRWCRAAAKYRAELGLEAGHLVAARHAIRTAQRAVGADNEALLALSSQVTKHLDGDRALDDEMAAAIADANKHDYDLNPRLHHTYETLQAKSPIGLAPAPNPDRRGPQRGAWSGPIPSARFAASINASSFSRGTGTFVPGLAITAERRRTSMVGSVLIAPGLPTDTNICSSR